MRLLVTGATGFAGSVWLDSLPESVSVTILGRNQPKSLKENWTFVSVDLSNEASVRDAGNQVDGNFDVLVHLAAHVPRIGVEDVLTDAITANVYATALLLEVFGGRVQRHVLGSTVEVYDQAKITGSIGANTPVGPVSYYASTKLSSEYIALSYAKKNSLPTIILRFSVMYGPSDPIARAIPNFIKKAIANEEITVSGGDTLRDYIYVDDIAKSINDAVNSSAIGVVAIGSGRGIAIAEVARQVVKIADSKSIVTSDKGKSVDIVIDASEAAELIGFVATSHFPDHLEEIIQSYKV